MPIFYHTAEKQCFQSLQCGAVHSRILSKTQGRAGGRLQHPKWYFQRFRALNTIRSTMRHGSGPSDYFAVYVYRPAKPGVPWIMHLALFSIMGFVLTSCIIAAAHTWHWRRIRRIDAAYSSRCWPHYVHTRSGRAASQVRTPGGLTRTFETSTASNTVQTNA